MSEVERSEEESENFIVPSKSGNQLHGTRRREGNSKAEGPMKGKATRISSWGSASTRLDRIANLARKMPEARLTSLSHHIDIDFLYEAYRRTRKDGATGVDRVTAKEYAADLEGNLRSLLDRLKTGSYRAPPVRRVNIPKGDGRTRPIGIPTLEDKVLQRAVTMVLESVYEEDFCPSSYGFRPKRSAHDALDAIWEGTMKMGGGWILDADIKSFFDDIDHGVLRDFLDKRIGDGVIRRVIGKWLKAGVMEDGEIRPSTNGTPQGGVVSPLLANLYLHEILDTWFRDEVSPRLRGRSFIVRYADDFVIGFASKADAERVLAVLPKRFARFGLTLHPEKTKLVPFRRPRRNADRDSRPGTFDFLGFTHYWAKSRKGKMIVKKKTMTKRLARGLRAINDWLRTHRHLPIPRQCRALGAKLKGHYAYYGVTGNSRALEQFARAVNRLWHKWLGRRSQRAALTWKSFHRILARHPLPKPRVVHSVYRKPLQSESLF